MATFAIPQPGRHSQAVVVLRERDDDRATLLDEASQAAAHVAIEARREDERRLDQGGRADADERGRADLVPQLFVTGFLQKQGDDGRGIEDQSPSSP